MNKNKERFFLVIIFVLAAFLRFFQLGNNPASLYWDEAAIGLDALSISQTGKDMNNMFWLQPVLGSYGDFKAPVLIWAASLSVKFLGMNPFAIRLPVAIFSLLLIYLSYLLVKELLNFDHTLAKRYKLMPILTAFILSISPWSTHFARIAFESSFSVSFLLLAILFFLKALKHKNFYFLISTFFAVLAVYSYYSLRIIVPLLFVALVLIFFAKIKNKKAWLFSSVTVFVLSMLPMLNSPYYERSQDYRLNNDNLIRRQRVIAESSQYLEAYGSNLYSKLVYHRHLLALRDFTHNMLTHFSPSFLFLKGDSNLRQHSGYFGEFLLVSLPFYYLGLFIMIKNWKSKISQLLLAFLLISPIPAAMVYEVPHASRAIYLFIPMATLIAWGLNEAWHVGKRLFFGFIVLLFLVNAVFYYNDYFIDYPKRSSEAWLYSYNQVGQYLRDHHKDFYSVEIDERYWLPRIFVYYYFPELIGQTRELKNALLNNPINSFGLADPFDYIYKEKDFNKKQAKFIYYESDIPDGFTVVEKFNFLNGDPSLVLVTK